MTISAGWWMLPTAVTIILFSVARMMGLKEPDGTRKDFGMRELKSIARYGAAIAISLWCWFVYALTN